MKKHRFSTRVVTNLAAAAVLLATLSTAHVRAQEAKDDWPVIVNPIQADDSKNATTLACRNGADDRATSDACLADAGITSVLTLDEAEQARAAIALSAGQRPDAQVDCGARIPDSHLALETAWTVYQPNRPLSDSVRSRQELFTVQALLLSAGMFGGAPMDPQAAFGSLAQEFVRDFGASRLNEMADALANLAQAFESGASVEGNCGLSLLHHAFRIDPVTMSTEFVFQTVGSGITPMFQKGIHDQIQRRAWSCSIQRDVISRPETMLGCIMLSLGSR
jgi:hypothetical protein